MTRFFSSSCLFKNFSEISLSFAVCIVVGCVQSTTSRLENAEQLSDEGRYQEAIEIYRHHIDERLAVSDRPDWENPRFYLLQIADLQLRLAQPKQALQTCVEAERAGVEPALVADRYRTVAHWYEERGDLQSAFEVLKQYRDRDPLLFEALLDRVGRALTAAER